MAPLINIYAEKRENSVWKRIGTLKGKPEDIQKFPHVSILSWIDATIGDVSGRKTIDILLEVGNEPIRGCPEDLSHELRTFFAFNDLLTEDDFYSWLTLPEILNFDWQGHTFVKSASIMPKYAMYVKYFDSEKSFPYDCFPEDWRLPPLLLPNGSVTVMQGEPITNHESAQVCVLQKIRGTSSNNGIKVHYKQSYAEECGYFLDAIEQLKSYGDPENIRVILQWGW